MSLHEITALRINGEEASLGKVLRLARIRNSFAALDEKIESILVRQAAPELGIKISDEELQAGFDEFRTRMGLYTSQSTLEWLEQQHLEIDDLEELVESMMLAAKVREAVSASHIEKFFSENLLSFESAVISQIMVREEGEARELLQQITDEEADFNNLAREYSIDESTRLAGGYTGSVTRSMLNSEIEAAVFGASAGNVVGPFNTENAYYLIKIEKLNKPSLDPQTVEQIKNALYRDWLATRYQKSTIEITVWDQI
ncbi:MAG: peptidylprolyl isomerase [Candidatus Saccharibacteria bacterium]